MREAFEQAQGMTRLLFEQWSKEDANPPRRHHYVPQFYLRRWADEREQLTMLNRVNGKRVPSTVRRACTEVDLYTVETEEGETSHAIERMLSWIEGRAATAIDDILSGHGPTMEQKADLSMFLALQATRGRDNRARHEYFMQHMDQTLLEMNLSTPETTKRWLQEQRNRPVSDEEVASMMAFAKERKPEDFQVHPNMAIRLMLDSSLELSAIFFARRWNTVNCPEGLLITSDHPVTAVRRRNPWGMGGLGDAHEVLFPLSPSALLVMDAGGGAFPDELTGEELRRVVDHLAFFAWEWVLGPPEHPWYEGIGSTLIDRPRLEPTISEYEMEDGSTIIRFHYEDSEMADLPEAIAHRSEGVGPVVKGSLSMRKSRSSTRVTNGG